MNRTILVSIFAKVLVMTTRSLITYPFHGAPHQLFTMKNNCTIEALHSYASVASGRNIDTTLVTPELKDTLEI